jgi:hypothetical protein
VKTVTVPPKPVFFPAEHCIVVLRDQRALGLRSEDAGELMAVIQVASADSGARWNDLGTAKQGHMLALGGVDSEGRGSIQVWDFPAHGAAASSAPAKNSQR